MDKSPGTSKKTLKILEEDQKSHRQGVIAGKTKEKSQHIEFEVIRMKIQEYLEQGAANTDSSSHNESSEDSQNPFSEHTVKVKDTSEQPSNVKEYHVSPKYAPAQSKPPLTKHQFSQDSLRYMSLKNDKNTAYTPMSNKDLTEPRKPGSQEIPHHIVNKVRAIQDLTVKQMLITSSEYNGVWRDALQCMDGYGTYTYPDGSEYRGYFSQGHFNGYGTLHLADPYNFTFKGTFIDGSMTEIEDMWFDDGLHVKATFENGKADFSDWKYCYPLDRRYSVEQAEGLAAVGPFSNLTNEKPTRNLAKKSYDVGGGFFNPGSGVIMARPKPFSNLYVPCPDEVDWISKHCRQSADIKPYAPPSVVHKIIENNLKSAVEVEEQVRDCNYDQELLQKRYFSKLCNEFDRVQHVSEDSLDYFTSESTSSEQSIPDQTILVEVQEFLETGRQYEKLLKGRDLEREASTIVSEPFHRDSKYSTNVSFHAK